MNRDQLDESVTIIVRGLVLAGIVWLIVNTTEVRQRLAVVEYRMAVLEQRTP